MTTRSSDAMTVQDLHDELERQINLGNGNLPVHVAYNYGDYWKTKVAVEVDNLEEAQIEFSGYHSMFRLAKDDVEDEDNLVRAVVINFNNFC